MAARVSGSSSTRMTRTGQAGAGDADREAEAAGAAEGSGTEPSLGACADTITIPTAQAPDGAALELRADWCLRSRAVQILVGGRSATGTGRLRRAPGQVRAHDEPALTVGAGMERAAADRRPLGHAAQARAALGLADDDSGS